MKTVAAWLSRKETGKHQENLNNINYYQSVTNQRWAAATLVPNTCLYQDDDGKTYITAGTPYWEDLDSQGISTAQQLERIYQRYGSKLLHHTHGSFALVIIDPQKDLLLAAVDRMGTQNLAYYCSGDTILIAGECKTIKSLSPIPLAISRQAIFNYLYYHVIPSPATIYQNVFKLEPGQMLEWQNGELKLDQYWIPDFTEHHASEQDLKKELHNLLDKSVSRCLSGSGTIGAFLSGGLDSSTVTGYLAKHVSGADSFSIGFDQPGYDEMEYARIAANHFKTTPHEFYLNPEIATDNIADIAAYYDEPFGNSSALPTYFCAKLAKDNGIDTLLAGDGGDEIFAGNARYAKQIIFSHYARIPKVLRSTLLEPLFLRTPLKMITPTRKVARYIEQAIIDMPERLETYNFLYNTKLDDIFSNEFLDQVDPQQPTKQLSECYEKVKGGDIVKRMLHLDWKFTLADNDLKKVGNMCAMAGVNVRYPMLDDELISFSNRIPSNKLINARTLRKFYKNSMHGFLPNEILNKSKHGFGLPFGLWMKSHKPLTEIAYSAMEKMRERNILNNEFIDQSIKQHQEGHAAYYGELIWITMMLELWLQHNEY